MRQIINIGLIILFGLSNNAICSQGERIKVTSIKKEGRFSRVEGHIDPNFGYVINGKVVQKTKSGKFSTLVNPSDKLYIKIIDSLGNVSDLELESK